METTSIVIAKKVLTPPSMRYRLNDRREGPTTSRVAESHSRGVQKHAPLGKVLEITPSQGQ